VFNQNKGSIPVRLGHDMSKFDDCAKKSAIDFVESNKAGGLVPSFAHQMAQPSAAQGAIQDVVSSFMNSDMSSKDAVAKFLEASKKH
jgi:glucose/mannose transport system substrate-binding protein